MGFWGFGEQYVTETEYLHKTLGVLLPKTQNPVQNLKLIIKKWKGIF